MNFQNNKQRIHTVYINHHATRLASLERAENVLRQEIRTAQADLGRFVEFNSELAHSALSQLKREIQALREQLGETDRAIELNTAQLAKARKAAALGFFGRFYKTTEQSVAILQVSTFEGRGNELHKEKARLRSALAQKEPDEKVLAANLESYRTFDPLETRAILAHKSLELEQIQSGKEQATKTSKRWEAAAGELARNYAAITREIRSIESDLTVAETLYKDLAAAQTGREKARIRQDCQTRFGLGNGSPGAVLTERTGARGKLIRDAEKIEQRLREKVSVLDKEIAKFILDGSNLCYAKAGNGEICFVGLAPLMALVPRLCESYAVELWFDPGIVRQTKMEKSNLEALFPGVGVEVMSGKQQADAAILGAAEHDEHAYVISNDRFVDFPEKDAVKNTRIFEHIIHSKSIQIMALDLNIPYQRDLTPA